MVKEAKKHLSLIFDPEKIDFDIFSTVLTEIERILNTRPITYASSDIKDMTTLSPMNFLNPAVSFCNSADIFPPAAPNGENLRLSWQKSRKLIDVFWARWKSEYLHTLQKRNKWQKRAENLYIGQIVLMTDDQKTRDQWNLARVIRVEKNGDHVRSVTVETANGKTYVRHVTKLVQLELDG